MAEITPGNPSYTLTELLHAVNIMMTWTEKANAAAAMWTKLGLTVDTSGYAIQTIVSDTATT